MIYERPRPPFSADGKRARVAPSEAALTQRGAGAAFGWRRRVGARRAARVVLSRSTAAPGLLNGRARYDQTPAPEATHLVLHPPARDAELSDLAARVNWYLPDMRFPVVAPRTPRTEVNPAHAPWMDPALVHEPAWRNAPPRGRAHEVIHRPRTAGAFRAIRKGPASIIAAPEFSTVADLGWCWLRWHFASMSTASSSAASQRLFALGGPRMSAIVLATGPTARLANPDGVDAEVPIVCNSAVRDRDCCEF